MQYRKFIILGLMLTLLSACSTIDKVTDVFKGRKVDYKKQSRAIERLEMPPEMNSHDFQDLLPMPNLASENQGYQQNAVQAMAAQAVLPLQKGIRVLWEDDTRVLLVNGYKKQVWNKVKEYFLQRDIALKYEDAATGILETDWLENKADVPQGVIRETLSKALEGMYSSDLRDKYRIRLEQEQDVRVIKLYATHYGIQEIEEGGSSERVVWRSRPRDRELEVQLLNEMMIYFGMNENKARALLAQRGIRAKDRAEIIEDNGIEHLRIKTTFPRAWRKIAVALDQLGFSILDNQRGEGLYKVKYADPMANDKSWLDYFIWDSSNKNKAKPYQIKLSSQGDVTMVSLLDDEGELVDNETSSRIMQRLYEQLR